MNGDLLREAEAEGFDVFVTTDRNLRYRQNLTNRKIAIVVLGQGRWKLIKTHVPETLPLSKERRQAVLSRLKSLSVEIAG